MSATAVADLLYHDCGLKGLSGISNDVRELQSSTDPRAAFALDYFCYRVGLNAGMLAAALGGVDAFVFTAGIGENSAAIRAGIAARLAWLGAILDAKANAAHASRISAPESRIGLYVIPTNEELMIARHTMATLSAKSIQWCPSRTCSLQSSLSRPRLPMLTIDRKVHPLKRFKKREVPLWSAWTRSTREPQRSAMYSLPQGLPIADEPVVHVSRLLDERGVSSFQIN